jgi:hypothetical protein
MTRLLLALVALLTGLAVQSAPAAARICAGAEVGVVAVERGERAVAVRALPGAPPLARQRIAPGERACAIARSQPVIVPTVQLRIDIAHE